MTTPLVNAAIAAETDPAIVRRRSRRLGGAALSVGALGYGFGDCLFRIDTADTCVANASALVDDFQALGMHFIGWIEAILRAAF